MPQEVGMKKSFICCLFMPFLISCLNLHAQADGYDKWLERRDELKKDPGVARYYTFEEVADSKSIVADLGRDKKPLVYVPYVDPATKETFDDLQVIEGRWPGKKAVRIDRGYYKGEAYHPSASHFSVEAWFRRQGPGSIIAASKLKDGTLFGVSGYTMGWRVTTSYEQYETLRFSIGQPAGATTVSTAIPLPDNVWHHVAVTWDGEYMKLYVNGKLASGQMKGIIDRKISDMKVFGGKYVPTTVPFKIGFSEHGVGSVKLDVDEMVIYNRVLSPEEIGELGKGPSGVSSGEVFARADSFIGRGDYDSARREYEKLRGLPSYGREFSLFNTAESWRLEKKYDKAHEIYGEILKMEGLAPFYRIYGLFMQAEMCLEEKDYRRARDLLKQVEKVEGALGHHLFMSRLKTGDSYMAERKHSQARSIYTKLLAEEERSAQPHEGYRLDLRNRLEEIDGLADGSVPVERKENLAALPERPGYRIYVAGDGKGRDDNPGTEEKPFATIERARDEIRKIKAGPGLPDKGIVVYLRGGRYFLSGGIKFEKEDSGTWTSPIVYRSYPGEEARIIGGRQVANFRPLSDAGVIRRLPEEAKSNVWVADLREAGITDYGKLANRGGYGPDALGALELFFNGRVMQLARWPNEGYARVAGLPRPDGEAAGRGPYQFGLFNYSGDRPERWLEEKDAWLSGFWYFVYSRDHVRLGSIDVKNKTISLRNDLRWGETYMLYKVPVGKNVPYYVYNLLSEIDSPGEWYLDRETGKLYFYPPGNVETGESVVSMLNEPLLSMDGVSHVVFFGITLEATRSHGVEIKKGRNNLVAGSVIRNTGQWAVNIRGGFEHAVVGCDIYDTGEGGVSLDFVENRSATVPYRKELIPARHLVENNHIYRFNRFDGGYRQGVRIDGVGQVVSHNVIHDSPMQGIYFNANDHVIEFNELHDVVHEGRELGAIYIYGEPWYLMSRGTVIRNNFFHHLSYHSSPNLNQGLNAIHIDAINGGLVIEKNFFYRFPNGVSNPQPENRIENNIFVDAEIRSIGQGDRSGLFNTIDGEPIADRISTLAARYLTWARYKQPPWSYRYPQLFDMLYRKDPVGLAKDNVIERNVNTGGPFLSVAGGIRDRNTIRSNWDGEDPFFVDRKKGDFRIRPGSPVYGLSGCEPVSMEGIGVYKDPLRASWPIKRSSSDIGKYYKPDWKPIGELSQTILAPIKRVSPPLYYTVEERKKKINVDGMLGKDEWEGLDMKKAMVIENYYKGDQKKEGAKSYAWLMYDRDNLYVAMKHEPDPYKEGMPARLKGHIPVFEIAVESQNGPHSRGWWSDDMVTGPIYSMTFKYSGELSVNNLFGMPHADVRKIEESIEYKRHVLDDENKSWTSEVRIPWSSLGINPLEVEQLAFNIGTEKKVDWFAWVAPGASIWRVENAGFIRFAR